ARRLPISTPFPYTTLFRSRSPLHPTVLVTEKHADNLRHLEGMKVEELVGLHEFERELWAAVCRARATSLLRQMASSFEGALSLPDRKSTRLNSSHVKISYA